MYLIAILSYSVIILLVMMFSKCNLYHLLNFPTLFLFLIILIPTLIGTGTIKDFKNAFIIAFNKKKSYSLIELKKAGEAVELGNKTFFLTSGLISLLEILILLHRLTDPSELGPHFSVIILTLLYSIFLSMILMPLKFLINNRIISYMDENERVSEDESDIQQRIYYRLRSFGLTDREAEVARLISTGMTNREISKELFITETTVKKHVTHILEKTHLENRDAITRIIKEL